LDEDFLCKLDGKVAIKRRAPNPLVKGRPLREMDVQNLLHIGAIKKMAQQRYIPASIIRNDKVNNEHIWREVESRFWGWSVKLGFREMTRY
jgi:hypothetical protein